MYESQNYVSKLPKLTGDKDYIPWWRLVFAAIQRHDYQMIGFLAEPEANPTPDVRSR